MRVDILVQLSSVILLLFFVVPHLLAQKTQEHNAPLDGSTFIGGHFNGAFTIASIDEGVIPGSNGSFTLSSPTGNGFEVGLSVSRLMPNLFLSTSTTAEARFFYGRQSSSSSGFGVVSAMNGTDKAYTVEQSTSATITTVGLQSRLIFDTRKMERTTPTVSIGVTLGHITDILYETQYTPSGVLQNPDGGLPAGTSAPERRWFYAAAHIGGGGRISLGDPATSPAILPELELIIPMTSFARSSQWIAFGLRAGIGLRWPL